MQFKSISNEQISQIYSSTITIPLKLENDPHELFSPGYRLAQECGQRKVALLTTARTAQCNGM